MPDILPGPSLRLLSLQDSSFSLSDLFLMEGKMWKGPALSCYDGGEVQTGGICYLGWNELPKVRLRART
jgi:hypothetical protein